MLLLRVCPEGFRYKDQAITNPSIAYETEDDIAACATKCQSDDECKAIYIGSGALLRCSGDACADLSKKKCLLLRAKCGDGTNKGCSRNRATALSNPGRDWCAKAACPFGYSPKRQTIMLEDSIIEGADTHSRLECATKCQMANTAPTCMAMYYKDPASTSKLYPCGGHRRRHWSRRRICNNNCLTLKKPCGDGTTDCALRAPNPNDHAEDRDLTNNDDIAGWNWCDHKGAEPSGIGEPTDGRSKLCYWLPDDQAAVDARLGGKWTIQK